MLNKTKTYNVISSVDFDLHLPNEFETCDKVLLLGNIAGFFGYFDGNDINLERTNLHIREYVYKLAQRLNNNKDTYIIGNKFVFNYICAFIKLFAKWGFTQNWEQKRGKYTHLHMVNIKSDEDYISKIKSLTEKDDMQFDLVIANPPYGNLGNPIISETVSHLTDNGVASVLMPIRWLLDPLALQKRNSDWIKYSNIRECIEDLYLISRECAEKLFNIQLDTQLAVYKISKKGGYDFSKIREDDRIRNLAINYKDKIKDYVQVINDTQSIFIDILEVYGGNVVRGNWIKPFGYKKPLASTAKGNSVRKGTIFNTIAEAKNFYEYSNLRLFKYWNITLKSGYHFYFGKYFPDLRNVHWADPVTGIQYDGYKVKWTNEALYRYFGITTDEISKIEKKVDQYSKAYKS